MNYGLLETLQGLEDYVLGANQVPFITFQPDGDWSEYLPQYEAQADRFETNGCAVWGTENQIEILTKRVYNVPANYSERFTYLMAGVDPATGIDPQAVYESIRRDGMVDQEVLPMTNTLSEFTDRTVLTGSLLAKGQNWLLKNDFKHEWLWSSRPTNALEIMKKALQTSPLGVTVTAWYLENGVYIDREMKNNHWCVCYKIDDEGIHVFDSYDHSKKILALDHYIGRAKRIWLNEKTVQGSTALLDVLKLVFNRLMGNKTLLDVCEAHIGTDASPHDLAPDELGCAETVTTLLREVYPSMPILIGTNALYQYLQHPQNGWTRVLDPQPECVVISPTGYGNPGTHGHTGFVLKDNVIASNDSATGKFIKTTLSIHGTSYSMRDLATLCFIS